MNFVLDASVALAWCFEDEGGVYATKVLRALRDSEAVVASHWPLEITNGLLTAERRSRVSAAEVSEIVGAIQALPIVVDPVARTRAFQGIQILARKHGLTSYDAAYLELAARLTVPLATLDASLKRAARKEGVELYS